VQDDLSTIFGYSLSIIFPSLSKHSVKNEVNASAACFRFILPAAGLNS
jgi:hypothetical protein